MTSLARRERSALCDLALEVGPASPTMCSGWTARDLVVHLLLRERNPLAAAGIVAPPLARFTDRAARGLDSVSYAALVERLRSVGWMFALPGADRAANTFEYLVHHEDLRRGQPSWQPRDLDPADADEIWTQLTRAARLMGRKLPAPTVLHRADTESTAVAKKGSDPVRITGDPVELVLFLFGRSGTRGLDFQGPADRVAAVKAADLGV